MALITETGTGASNSESFCSVAAANDYHKAIGNDAWADLDTTEKEQALRRATHYLEGAYRVRWTGTRCYSTQALSWPREFVQIDGFRWPHDQIPKDVVHACALLALKSTTESLAPDLEREVRSESVGSLSVTYAPGSVTKRFREVDLMIAHLLRGSTNSIALGRS